jgi:murein DD-endopeptidase MepM/ murein hydrolase activator NlpD
VGKVNLNRFGRIEIHEEKAKAEYLYERNEYFIKINDNELIGNSLLIASNGYLTITCEHENIPSWLRFYRNDGHLLYERQFAKIINLILSANSEFAAFFDGNHLQILNLSTFEMETHQKSVQFAVNNQGEPLFIDENGNVRFKQVNEKLPKAILAVHFVGEVPLAIGRNSIYAMEEKWKEILSFQEKIFDSRSLGENLYFVLNNKAKYELYKFDFNGQIEKLEEIIFEKASYRREEPILAPLLYGEENYPYPIGNSYAEIQHYGGTPYLHPGVDLLGDDFQEVYSVKDGYVKAILTTGGAPYWRVAVANENVSGMSKGYLYAHLNQSSIPFNVGDFVQAGDLLGTLYPWDYYDFTHIHFAKIYDSGAQWYGDWWSTENVLFDMTNVQDTIPPIFENALPDSRYAFRDENGDYLNFFAPLSGDFDIIVKCHDLANSDWKIDVHELRYSLLSVENPGQILFEKHAYTFDFDLDTYANGTVDNWILNTIYSTDALDASQAFDSSQFPDGAYWLKVTASDANLNTTVDSMLVFFENGNTEIESDWLFSSCKLSNYPNPFNPETTIHFQLPEKSINPRLVIFNARGQRIRQYHIHNEKEKTILWDGKDDQNKPVASGLYFYQLLIDNRVAAAKKMILMK